MNLLCRWIARPAAVLLATSVAAMPVLAAAGSASSPAGPSSSAGPSSPAGASSSAVPALAAAPDGMSGAGRDPRLGIETSGHAEMLHVVVGRSMVLKSAERLRRVFVGNPAVLQSFTSSPNEVVITARQAGISSMVMWDVTGNYRLYTVSADLDPEDLRDSLRGAFPGEEIHAAATEGKIYLSGTVSSQASSDAAVKLASLYAKDVVNSLLIIPVHAKQVQLKLRIVEVDRTRLEQFGVNFFTGGKNASSASTQQFNVATAPAATGGLSALTVSDPLNLFFYNSALNVGVTVKDLEQKQILQVLAEPTLTALSGQSARFLSGGEFPFPVVQGGVGAGVAISIMFQPYGVKMDFTPTVNQDGTIRLKVVPEVSTLDYTNAVTISGFTIPALSTRRAETEVELNSGQSFIVSGLLDHRTTEILSKVPGIGDIPILGQLFRSKNFNHSVIELVVIVTATVVDPLTNETRPVEPKMAVPNMKRGDFDTSIKELQKNKPATLAKPGQGAQ